MESLFTLIGLKWAGYFLSFCEWNNDFPLYCTVWLRDSATANSRRHSSLSLYRDHRERIWCFHLSRAHAGVLYLRLRLCVLQLGK
jgi:hypothetical protein